MILGIDPDISCHTCAVIAPDGDILCLMSKSKVKGKVRVSQEDKLALATESINHVVCAISNWGIRGDAIQVYVEHQNAAHCKKEQKIKWQDLINAAHISGIWTGALSSKLCISPKQIHIVYARTWKQQQSKWINQRRTLDALGLEHKRMGGQKPFPTPTNDERVETMFRFSPEKPNPGDFVDITDSLGIALYGHKQYVKECRRSK